MSIEQIQFFEAFDDFLADQGKRIGPEVAEWIERQRIAPRWRRSPRRTDGYYCRGDLVEVYQHSGALTVRFSPRVTHPNGPLANLRIQIRDLGDSASYTTEKVWDAFCSAFRLADAALGREGWVTVGGSQLWVWSPEEGKEVLYTPPAVVPREVYGFYAARNRPVPGTVIARDGNGYQVGGTYVDPDVAQAMRRVLNFDGFSADGPLLEEDELIGPPSNTDRW